MRRHRPRILMVKKTSSKESPVPRGDTSPQGIILCTHLSLAWFLLLGSPSSYRMRPCVVPYIPRQWSPPWMILSLGSLRSQGDDVEKGTISDISVRYERVERAVNENTSEWAASLRSCLVVCLSCPSHHLIYYLNVSERVTMKSEDMAYGR